MYKEFETKTSYKYLQEVIKHLNEPICILGGWAVFFHVNKKYQEAKNTPYLGSRDIDLGFHLKEKMTPSELAQSSLGQTIHILRDKLHFKPLSFRFLKEIHTETEEELSDSRHVPSPFIFLMYVDLIVDAIPPDFKKTLNFSPIDEPLLSFAFTNEEYRRSVTEFHRKLLLPAPELLIAMKMTSLPQRDKVHKKIKDICDLFSLLWYSDIKKEILEDFVLLSKTKIQECQNSITKEEFEKAGQQLGHTAVEIRRVIELVK
jgi:hypothetical protein